jgi:hypothetical protein
MTLRARRTLAVLLFAGWVPSAAALDPLTSFAISFVWNVISNNFIEPHVSSYLEQQYRALGTARRNTLPPAPALDDRAHLRRLIDEGFPNLSSAQRDEVQAALDRIVDDPAHSNERYLILMQFTARAEASREAHRRFAALSGAEKREMVSQIRERYDSLPPTQREHMLATLRAGQMPLPRDLNELILAELAVR